MLSGPHGNPASIYCEHHGGQLQLIVDGQGYCRLPSGQMCDEWAYKEGNFVHNIKQKIRKEKWVNYCCKNTKEPLLVTSVILISKVHNVAKNLFTMAPVKSTIINTQKYIKHLS